MSGTFYFTFTFCFLLVHLIEQMCCQNSFTEPTPFEFLWLVKPNDPTNEFPPGGIYRLADLKLSKLTLTRQSELWSTKNVFSSNQIVCTCLQSFDALQLYWDTKQILR